MKINRKNVISTLALIGLTLGTSVSAAEIAHRSVRFEQLTVSQQSILEEAHELHKQGKDKEAKTLIQSVGIELTKKNKGHREVKKHGPRFELLKTALEQENYTSFKVVAEGTHLLDVIDTEEKFNAFIQAHELRLEGKVDEAKEILEEADLKPMGKKFSKKFKNENKK